MDRGRLRCLATAGVLTLGVLATAASADKPPSDFKLRRAFAKAAPGAQLQLLRQFTDPWQALGAALSRPSFRAALARNGETVELASRKRIFVEDCGGFSVHRESVYCDRRLLLHPGGEVSVKSEHHRSVISAEFDPPGTLPRVYFRPERDSCQLIGKGFRNPYWYPFVAGGLHKLGVRLTTADVASLVERLENGDPALRR